MSDRNELLELPGIPDTARPLWGKLLAEQPIPLHQLFRDVRAYQDVLARSSRLNETTDSVLAGQLVSASMRLLGTVGDAMPEPRRRAIQAAIRYFVLEEDADSDLGSVLGLDDDAEVLNAVLRYVGREEWTVAIP